jgi:hypothetical protein
MTLEESDYEKSIWRIKEAQENKSIELDLVGSY